MECEQAERHRTIVRQGDVLAAHPGTSNWADRWRRFYIVLSADCDIVNQKLDTGLVVVPVVGLQTYARDMWLPEQLKRQLKAAERKAEPLIRRFPNLGLTFSQLTARDKALLESDLNGFVADDDELRKPATSLTSIVDAVLLIRSIEGALDQREKLLGDLVQDLCRAKALISGTAADPTKELKTGFASVADPKRNDLWPICDLVGLDGQMREDERDGFVAALRRFGPISLETVQTDKAEWLRRPDSYLRVCRLRGIYKTDFLHRFASLFTRVGLDAGRDDEHQRIFDLAAARALKQGEKE